VLLEMTQTMKRRARLRAAALLALFLCVVTGLTVAAAAVPGVTGVLAASARDVLRGQIWRLLTSGLLAERPVAASLVSFSLLAILTVVLCGHRVLLLSAVAGNVGSALLAYLLIGAVRVADSGALAAEWRARDYGVSAISAAWLGAIAATGWRARRSSTARAAVVLGCVAIGAFAYTLHPGITLLASEHVTAFAIGAVVAWGKVQARSNRAVATRALPRLLSRRRALARLDPVAVAAVGATVVLVGGSVLPSALASLREELLAERLQSLQCARGPAPDGGLPRPPRLLTCQTRRETLAWKQSPGTARRSVVARVVP
jgi:hypothetical protein